VKEFDVPAVVAADPEANATDLLIDRVAATPDRPLFALPTADGGWKTSPPLNSSRRSWPSRRGSSPPASNPGTKIGLMCKTSFEWTLIDFATWFAGAVLVPIYETSAPSQILWKPDGLGAVALITQTPRPLRTVR